MHAHLPNRGPGIMPNSLVGAIMKASPFQWWRGTNAVVASHVAGHESQARHAGLSPKVALPSSIQQKHGGRPQKVLVVDIKKNSSGETNNPRIRGT